MAIQKLLLHPEDTYDFKFNAKYREEWNCIVNEEYRKVIAQQLTYLNFHEWLFNNLKYEEYEGVYEQLKFHVEEGFYKSDILIYASICELALFDVLEHKYKQDKGSMPSKALECFEKKTDDYVSLDGKKVTVELGKDNIVTSNLYVLGKKNVQVKDRDRHFDMLIKGCLALNVYDSDFYNRLDALRGWRNNIHLTAQVNSKKKNSTEFFFNSDKREEAKQITNELKSQIEAFYLTCSIAA